MSDGPDPPSRRPLPLLVAGQRSALRRLPRHRMGRAGAGRPGPVREADPRRLPGRPVLDHHPAQARRLSPGLRGLRPRRRRPLHAGARRGADARRGHRAQPRQDRGHDRRRPRLSRAGGARGLLPGSCGASSTARRSRTRFGAGPRRPPRRRSRAASPRRSRRRASRSAGRRSSTPSCRRSAWSTTISSAASATRNARRSPRPTRAVPDRTPAASATEASPKRPRAWQRMLSGRRLDLLDPSPLDVEIEDIAHGLARVARWNGQTLGPADLLRRPALAPGRGDRRASGAGADRRRAPDLAPARRAGIRDRRHHLALQGGGRRRLQGRGGAAARRDPPPLRPAPAAERRRSGGCLKRADRIAAFHEATRLAGFGREEASKLFGRPDPLPPAIDPYLSPWPIAESQARYLARVAELRGGGRIPAAARPLTARSVSCGPTPPQGPGARFRSLAPDTTAILSCC